MCLGNIGEDREEEEEGGGGRTGRELEERKKKKRSTLFLALALQVPGKFNSKLKW